MGFCGRYAADRGGRGKGRNLKDEKNGQRHGGKEEKEQDRKDDRRAGCPGVAAGRAVRGSG